MSVIELKRLSKRFVTEAGGTVPVLDGIDLTVGRGEFVCVLGPTGCGKTTLLRLLVGLEEPTAGAIRMDASAGMVFQQNSLLPWRRVWRNVAFPLEMEGVGGAEARAQALEYLRVVDLEESAGAFPYELSGGMQQRAAIARALVGGREILLLDEPFGALDDQTRLRLQEALLEIWRERRTTIVFVTHNIEEALLLGDRVLVLGRGRVLADEPIDLSRPRDRLGGDFTAALIRLRRTFAEAIGG